MYSTRSYCEQATHPENHIAHHIEEKELWGEMKDK